MPHDTLLSETCFYAVSLIFIHTPTIALFTRFNCYILFCSICNCFVHSDTGDHLYCFPVCISVNNVAKNINAHISMQNYRGVFRPAASLSTPRASPKKIFRCCEDKIIFIKLRSDLTLSVWPCTAGAKATKGKGAGALAQTEAVGTNCTAATCCSSPCPYRNRHVHTLLPVLLKKSLKKQQKQRISVSPILVTFLFTTPCDWAKVHIKKLLLQTEVWCLLWRKVFAWLFEVRAKLPTPFTEIHFIRKNNRKIIYHYVVFHIWQDSWFWSR